MDKIFSSLQVKKRKLTFTQVLYVSSTYKEKFKVEIEYGSFYLNTDTDIRSEYLVSLYNVPQEALPPVKVG